MRAAGASAESSPYGSNRKIQLSRLREISIDQLEIPNGSTRNLTPLQSPPNTLIPHAECAGEKSSLVSLTGCCYYCVSIDRGNRCEHASRERDRLVVGLRGLVVTVGAVDV